MTEKSDLKLRIEKKKDYILKQRSILHKLENRLENIIKEESLNHYDKPIIFYKLKVAKDHIERGNKLKIEIGDIKSEKIYYVSKPNYFDNIKRTTSIVPNKSMPIYESRTVFGKDIKFVIRNDFIRKMPSHFLFLHNRVIYLVKTGGLNYIRYIIKTKLGEIYNL